MKLSFYCVSRTPNSHSLLVQAISARSVRIPDELRPGIVGMRVYGQTTKAVHDNEYTPPLLLPLPPPRIQSSCPRIWSCCYWGRGDERDTSNGGGNIDKFSATKSTSGLPIGADGNGIRLPSWMQTETVPTIATQTEPVYANGRPERDAKGSKPKSLLRQQHIRVLLVIDALYSVCTYYIPSTRLFPCDFVGLGATDSRIEERSRGGWHAMFRVRRFTAMFQAFQST